MRYTRKPFSRLSKPPFRGTPAGEGQPRSPAVVRVLVVGEDEGLAESVRLLVATETDMRVEFCEGLSSAVPMALARMSTVILVDARESDVDAPGFMDTLSLQPALRDIPVIFVAAAEPSPWKVAAFRAGAAEVLPGLPAGGELVARLRNLSAAYFGLLDRDMAFVALQESQAALKLELEEASRCLRALLPASLDEDRLAADYLLLPSADLGGDALAYRWVSDEAFHVCLFDVSGHGVGAALLAMSVSHFLKMAAASGTLPQDPAEVLALLNKTFPMDAQNGMYFSMWYGVYRAGSRELTFASGGHPPALLVPGDGSAARRLSTGGFVLGAMGDAVFQSGRIQVLASDRLYVFSDGAYDLASQGGSGRLSVDTFLAELARPSRTGTGKLREQLDYARQVRGGQEFEDDFCLLEVLFR